jgi:hypothetical protein
MFTFDQTVRETEKNTQKDVLFLWRRIGDSIEASPLFLNSQHHCFKDKTPLSGRFVLQRRIGEPSQAPPKSGYLTNKKRTPKRMFFSYGGG